MLLSDYLRGEEFMLRKEKMVNGDEVSYVEMAFDLYEVGSPDDFLGSGTHHALADVFDGWTIRPPALQSKQLAAETSDGKQRPAAVMLKVEQPLDQFDAAVARWEEAVKAIEGANAKTKDEKKKKPVPSLLATLFPGVMEAMMDAIPELGAVAKERFARKVRTNAFLALVAGALMPKGSSPMARQHALRKGTHRAVQLRMKPGEVDRRRAGTDGAEGAALPVVMALTNCPRRGKPYEAVVAALKECLDGGKADTMTPTAAPTRTPTVNPTVNPTKTHSHTVAATVDPADTAVVVVGAEYDEWRLQWHKEVEEMGLEHGFTDALTVAATAAYLRPPPQTRE